MKKIEDLERKLKFWPSIKNKLLVFGLLTAAGVAGIFGTSYVWPGSGIKSKEVDKELISSVNISENDITPIRAKCLEDTVILGEFKKHEKLIRDVYHTTNVPEYVLAAMIDVAHYRATRAQSPAAYSWPGFVQVLDHEAGLEDVALQDPEQCLLSAAGKYKSILETVNGDEEVALGVFFLGEGTVKMAKLEANRYLGIARDFERWRDECDEEALSLYDDLLEQHKSAETEQEREEALQKIKLHWDSMTPSVPRGYIYDEPVYRALTSRGTHKLHQWWPENLSVRSGVNGVKIALRLKKDGYDTQPIGELREYESDR